MTETSLPASEEAARLQELQELGATRDLPDPRFSTLAAVAAQLCGTPIGLVSLLGTDHQYFKGLAGLTSSGMTQATSSFGSYTVRHRKFLEVPDALADARFRDDAMVAGEQRVRFYAGAPMISSNGHVLGSLCVMDHRPHRLSAEQQQILTMLADNATALLEAQHQARQADRIIHDLQDVQEIKDQFLSTINHELRTPLTSIRSYLEILQEGGLDDATQRQFLSVIKRNSDRILDLIDELLLMASLNADAAAFDPIRTDLTTLIRHAIDIVADRAQHKDQNLELDAPTSAAVWADSLRLQHALVHLLDNAIKFTPTGGTIKVTLHADPSPRLTICDDGIGIAADQLDHVFSDFYRTPEVERDAIPGTGMGLAMVKRIIEVHGGRVWIESTPGVGTCVRITLPVAPAAPSSDSEIPSL